jgi:site-specific DNA recombinase
MPLDEAVSGARDSRPALNEMLADARRGRFDLVLVVRLDRLGRNLRHLLTVLEELSEHGIAFASATEPIDTSSPAGRMVVAVLGAAAELERSLLRERTKAGLASRAKSPN